MFSAAWSFGSRACLVLFCEQFVHKMLAGFSLGGCLVVSGFLFGYVLGVFCS